jgi:hypothetical protein
VGPDDARAVVDVLAGGRALATLRVDGPGRDVAVVGALARLGLAARRRGWTLRVRCDAGLAGLVELCGLSGVLGVELGRQPERREQPLGVEEVVQRDEPPA